MLGGGGARGITQIGVIKELREKGKLKMKAPTRSYLLEAHHENQSKGYPLFKNL